MEIPEVGQFIKPVGQIQVNLIKTSNLNGIGSLFDGCRGTFIYRMITSVFALKP